MAENETMYNFGGDEYIFVELSRPFNLSVNFRIMGILTRILDAKLPALVDYTPGNSSFLIRYNPDITPPREMMDIIRGLEESITDVTSMKITGRIIEIPVLFNDPWTHETVMKYREGYHQQTELSDIDYCAKINGFSSADGLIKAICSAPYMVLNSGFIPGLAECYQLKPEEEQIQVPKYLNPRPYTPALAFSYAGAFLDIYPSESTGGAQLFGMCAGPTINLEQNLYDFQDSMILPKPGDLFCIRSIDMEEFKAIRAKLADGTFRYKTVHGFTFTPKDLMDYAQFAETIKRRLYA